MKARIFTFIFIVTGLLMTAQIKLGDNSTTITNSAMLEIESTTKGLLIPRMTSTQISSITTLTTGLMVYNTTLNCFSFYNGTAWSCIGSSTTSSFTSGSVLFSNGSAIAQNNSNLFWDNTNLKLGIGVSALASLYEKLQVNGNIGLGRWIDNYGSRFIGISDGSTKAAGLEIENTTLGGNYSQKLHLLTHHFNTNLGRRLTINEDGNVGIGETNNIYEKLTVNGNIGLGNTTDNFGSRFVGISDGIAKIAGLEIENTRKYTWFNSQKLHLITNDHYLNGSPPWGGRRLTINEDGNIGLGESDAIYQKLTVRGNIAIQFDDITSSATRFIGLSNSVGYQGVGMEIENVQVLACGGVDRRLHFSSSEACSYTQAGPRRMTITESGFVGIGTQTPLYRLQVTGNVAATGFVNTSDKRFKKDILPLKNSLEKILQLNGVTYNWDTATWKDRNFDNSNHIGFIAQEVEKIVPTAVNTGSDEMKSKSIAYNEFVPLLVESVKQLNKKIEQLEAEIKSLKK